MSDEMTDLRNLFQRMRRDCALSASPSKDTQVIISMFIFLRGVVPPENMYVYERGRSAFRGSLQDVGCAKAMHSPTDQQIEEAMKHVFVGMWVARSACEQDALAQRQVGFPTYKQLDNRSAVAERPEMLRQRSQLRT